MRKIRNIKDVVDWGLCVGCGACYYACSNQAITLENVETVGIRPRVDTDNCNSKCDCLRICPGYSVDGYLVTCRPVKETEAVRKFGPTLEIWQGYASDPEIRYAGSSGGALTALALYCLDNENTEFVLHTGMDPDMPYLNKTVRSRTREELLSRTGSRYAPASPCDSLEWINESEKPCVFIGKPCDAAAVSKLRRLRPGLNEKLSLVLTFFCAGTPSTAGTLNLIKEVGASPEEVNDLRYRGYGWPGKFRILYSNSAQENQLTYETSWGKLQRFRPFRCYLCPDGTGQVADISCGDAWHAYSDNGNAGLSIILIRTERGRKIFHRAMEAGFINAKSSHTAAVLAAQRNLLQRRTRIFGRLLSMTLALIPTPHLNGFRLLNAWLQIPLIEKIRTILGTLRRIFIRGLQHRNPSNL